MVHMGLNYALLYSWKYKCVLNNNFISAAAIFKIHLYFQL